MDKKIERSREACNSEADARKPKKVPRTFLSPAYLKVIEDKTFGLFRSVTIEEFDRTRGYPVRVPAGEIGPIRVLREAEPGEEARVVLKTFHPLTMKELSLVEV